MLSTKNIKSAIFLRKSEEKDQWKNKTKNELPTKNETKRRLWRKLFSLFLPILNTLI